MYEIIDTHCHLDMEEFDADRDDVIKYSTERGVKAIIVPATTVRDFEKEKSLCKQYSILYYMVGVHPHNAKTTDLEVYDNAIECLKDVKCVGMGEIGLDYYYEHSPRNFQRDVFANFLDIAVENKVPVSIHCRKAENDIVDILRARKDIKGIIHCFTGNEKLLKAGLDLGLYFGIGGVLTFGNSGLEDVIREISLKQIVFETDAPYLAPVPKRGKRNEPSYISYVIERMAEILDEDSYRVARIAFENAKSIFSLENI